MSNQHPPAWVIAIDPGDQESALVELDPHTFRPIQTFEGHNVDIRAIIRGRGVLKHGRLIVEYTPPYTMSTAGNHNYVPRQVVDTAIEVGRFIECWGIEDGSAELLSRTDIKKHLLGRSAGNDTAVAAAVVDRYASTRQLAKGTKKNPGPLYGFSGTHIYSALAVAVTWLEKHGYESPAKSAGRVF